jgi:D-glycero-alpha-D-manno-heptose 1-phosphate guanylyltransferase
MPKPAAPVGGVPFLLYLLKWLERNGTARVVLSIGYLGNVIRSEFGDRFGALEIAYCSEDTPLGTGGAIKKALGMCDGKNVFVVNGDTYFGIELNSLLRFHINNFADITIALKELTDFDRYGTVECRDGIVTGFQEKRRMMKGMINGGVYCLRGNIFDGLDMPDKFSFERDFLAAQNDRLRICGAPCGGNFIDIGIPEDYVAAQTLIPQWLEV